MTTITNQYAQGNALGPITEQFKAAAPQKGIHLYQFPLSLCSQKCRWILAEKGIKYQIHHILLPMNDQLLPNYVRINNRCVVPSFVEDGKVTTDSENIINLIDYKYEPVGSMTPSDPEEKKDMEDWLKIADGLYIEALTYSSLTPPGVPDNRSAIIKKMSKGAKDHKVRDLKNLIQKYKDDIELRTAYESKLAIVLKSSSHENDQEFMEKVHAELKSIM